MKNNKKGKSKPPCHTGFYEIFPNLFVGRERDIKSVCANFDVLVPLANLDGQIWDNGFNGEIMYIPICDFDTLPENIEKKYVEKIVNLLKNKKKIAIFCLGGHGRTGYFTSLILSHLGIEDPIYHIRTMYCKNTIESMSQLTAIAKYADNPELIENYKNTIMPQLNTYSTSNLYWYDSISGHEESINYKYNEEEKLYFTDLIGRQVCGDCAYCINNICYETGCHIGNVDPACSEFTEKYW